MQNLKVKAVVCVVCIRTTCTMLTTADTRNSGFFYVFIYLLVLGRLCVHYTDSCQRTVGGD